MITFKVIKSYPFSKFSLGDQIQFIDDVDQLKTKERELFEVVNNNPEHFEKQGDTKYFVSLNSQGYSVLRGSEIVKEKNSDRRYFNTEEERDMFFFKNKRLFSYEDISKLPLEAGQLHFFMQSVKNHLLL